MSWRTAWRALTSAIRCPACAILQKPGAVCDNEKCKFDLSKIKSPTAGLRFHDLRHHAITELAESPASEQTILAIAGHVSSRMLRHYSHIRLEERRAALDGLSGKVTPNSAHDTNYVTNGPSADGVIPQVIEKYGRPVETRTPDLYRVNESSYGTP
jgi:hypothetical protein